MDLSIVIPCYNEQEVLKETAMRMVGIVDKMIQSQKVSTDSRIYFVDDGSTDETWNIIEKLANRERLVSGIKLSRNRGHQNALLAGLFTASGDAIITIDADLQDDISLLENMVNDYLNGYDIVYGVRSKRSTDGFCKRITAITFYKFIQLLGVKTIFNHADFRLMSRRAVDALKQFNEVNLFLRGIVPLVGFKSSVQYYDRAERFAGSTKYPLRKMIGLAIDGVTSFSSFPLRLITMVGFIMFILSVMLTFWVFWIRFGTAAAVPGWASTLLPLSIMGGVQILCIGIVGEYMGKIYAEVKARPRYIIEKII